MRKTDAILVECVEYNGILYKDMARLKRAIITDAIRYALGLSGHGNEDPMDKIASNPEATLKALEKAIAKADKVIALKSAKNK